MAETVPGFDAGAWVMLFAPAGTPRPIVEALGGYGRPSPLAIRARLNELGATVTGTTPEEAAAIHQRTGDGARRSRLRRCGGLNGIPRLFSPLRLAGARCATASVKAR